MSDFSKPIDILGAFADPYSFEAGGSKAVNCRPMPRDPREGKPGKARLVGTPGLTLVCQPTNAAVLTVARALGTVWSVHADGSVWYGVNTASPVKIGSVGLGSTPIVRTAEDITGLAIATNYTGQGGAGAAYLATKTALTPGNFQTGYSVDPTTVCELDNTTIWGGLSSKYASGNTLKMYSSRQLAPITLTGAFASKEARADELLDLATAQRTYWALGAQTIEHFYDSGSGSDFAFVPFTNSLIPTGLAARRTLASVHDNICFVGTDKRVWTGTAQMAQPLGIEWLDFMLQQTPIASLLCYGYSHGGADYYVMTLPGVWTIEININTRTANYAQSFGRSDSARRCALEYEGAVTYVGLDTGHICMLDITTASEPAGTLPRTIISQYLGNLTSYHVIDAVTVSSSLGPAAGSFTLDWSEDGFATSKGVRSIILPKPGSARAIARQLGSSRRRQIRLQYTGTAAPFEFDEIFVDGSS